MTGQSQLGHQPKTKNAVAISLQVNLRVERNQQKAEERQKKNKKQND
jgi:hypothetical protein